MKNDIIVAVCTGTGTYTVVTSRYDRD